ncbi:MAG: rhomboid family intramembrane serine protease [Cyclobacteriaceae bacterium]
MWISFGLESLLFLDFGFLGVRPRTINGLIGVFTAPLVHGSFTHLMSNTFPLLFLGTTIYYFYNRIATQVFIQCFFFTNVLVWFFGRDSYHIGASGMVYGIAFFLISFGIFRRDMSSILISTVIIVFYGGLVYGIFPYNPAVSWESHLMGAIVGICSAFLLRKTSKIN